jgi:hypothetical protein
MLYTILVHVRDWLASTVSILLQDSEAEWPNSVPDLEKILPQMHFMFTQLVNRR